MSSLYAKGLQENEIRLLTISSYNLETAELELEIYQRDDTPEYDVVSWTWGQDEATTSVSCNMFPLQIRTTLFNALPYLHGARSLPIRPLWIDFICLDQNNDTEKEIHVPLMGTIYQNATRTLIWLGEEADDSDLAIDSMSRVTQEMLNVDPDRARLFLQQREDLRLLGLPAEYDPVWKSFQAIQLRPWYFRLWTLQEIVLGTEPLMICGTKTMPWDAVVMLQRAATRANLTPLVMPVDWDTSGMPGDLITTITFTHGLRTQLCARPTAIRLDAAIKFTMNRKYKQRVDRIWAILGLLDKRNREFCVKWDLIKYGPAAELDYHETYLGIMKMYTAENPVVGMKLFEDGLPQVHNPKLPSWCPDWSLERTSSPFSYMDGIAAGGPKTLRNIPASAMLPSGQLRPFISIDDNLTFHISGLIVDVVEKTTSTAGIFWGNYQDWRKRLDIIRITQSCNWLRECLDIINAASPPTASTSPVVEADHTPALPGRDVPVPVLQPFATLQSYMALLKDILRFDDDTLDNYSVRSWCQGRKFFRTEAGKFGIGPLGLEKGDVVCALCAGTPLFVLRPVDTAGELQQRYQVIGDAYVPDLMHGEGFTGKKWDSMQEFYLV